MAEYWVNNQASGANDGSSESDGFLTIQQSMTGVTAGDIIWIKGGSAYTESVTLLSAGTLTDLIIVEGYETVTGDTGKFILDGNGGSLTYGIYADNSPGNMYWYFKNMIVQNYSSHGIMSQASDRIRYFNCESNNNGGYGFIADNDSMYENCLSSGNAGDGFRCDSARFLQCKSIGNGGYGFYNTYGGTVYYQCISSKNEGYQVRPGYGSYFFEGIVDGNTSPILRYGYRAGDSDQNIIFNSLFYSCSTAIHMENDYKYNNIGRNNLLYGNDINYNLWSFSGTDIYDNPLFVDEESGNYNLQSDSPAINAGIDLSTGTTGMDIGPYQTQDEGSGTRIVMAG